MPESLAVGKADLELLSVYFSHRRTSPIGPWRHVGGYEAISDSLKTPLATSLHSEGNDGRWPKIQPWPLSRRRRRDV